uniref:Uncharacterized protein n=1 Tax=Opuntia streptacantha TaxID=393608 RepID=A0A7C9AXY9_OPUST
MFLPGANPAQGRTWARLENQFNSKFCETLGHKNTLSNVSNPCPKVGFWLTFASIPSHVKLLGGEWTTWSVLHSISFQPHIPTYQQHVFSSKHCFEQQGSFNTPLRWSILVVIIS